MLVKVRSTNVDKQQVTLHSLFYHILTSSTTNFLDFGAVVLNSPVLRTISIENISKKELILEISSSLPSELKIYTKSGSRPSMALSPTPSDLFNQHDRKEKLLESIQGRRKTKRTSESSSTSTSNTILMQGLGLVATNKQPLIKSESPAANDVSSQYLDLASTSSSQSGRHSPVRKTVGQVENIRLKRHGTSTSHSCKKLDKIEVLDVEASMTPDDDFDTGKLTTKLELTALLNLLEKENVPLAYGKTSSEARVVKTFKLLNRELSNCISDGILTPSSILKLEPDAAITVVLVLTAMDYNNLSIQVKPFYFRENLKVRMLKYL
jgi:hypothetical protein